MDLGFIILCPDRNIGGLRNTLLSISHNSYNREALAVVGSDATAAEIKTMKEICPIHKGKDTITSLINTGMKKLKLFGADGPARVAAWESRTPPGLS